MAEKKKMSVAEILAAARAEKGAAGTPSAAPAPPATEPADEVVADAAAPPEVPAAAEAHAPPRAIAGASRPCGLHAQLKTKEVQLCRGRTVL